eukprot:6209454-Amphidinium_carterae.1
MLREKIRVADNAHGHRTDESHRVEDTLAQLEVQQDARQVSVTAQKHFFLIAVPRCMMGVLHTLRKRPSSSSKRRRPTINHTVHARRWQDASCALHPLGMFDALEDYVGRKRSELGHKTQLSSLANVGRVAKQQDCLLRRGFARTPD